ncbi:metalloprotease family protein [Alkalibacillus sp. S2W]|uniref:metalloprotease family protein n=1 Tax=Alkalibacillus sp. S2W TaxID=3386553 RepID=UPI00398CE86D
MIKTYPLHKMSLLLLSKLIMTHYKIMIIAILLFTLIPLTVVTNWSMAYFILQFHIIFFGGFWLSFIIHEYLHVLLLKRSKKKGEVEVELTLLKMTLYPKFKLTSNEMIKVAILPLIFLFIFGLGLILLAKWSNQTFVMVIGFLYTFHMINLIPPLGDGMMLIKAIFNKKSSLERR